MPQEGMERQWVPSISPGQVFGEHYQILQELNLLGQWEAYLAQEIGTGKQVVIKFWKLTSDALVQFQPRLETRLYHLRNLQHPYILDILDYRFQHNRFYVVQEFCPWQTLQHFIKQSNPLQYRDVVALLTQVLSVIQHLHLHYLLHLNINPGKVFINVSNISRGFEIKLDAIGQILPSSLLNSGHLAKKYRAPELNLPDITSDASSDVYSIGLLGYELLTKVFPYPPYSLLVPTAIPDIPPMHRVAPTTKIPRNIEEVICKAISWKKKYRFVTCEEFSSKLTRSLKTQLHFQEAKKVIYILLILMLLGILYYIAPTIFHWLQELHFPDEAVKKEKGYIVPPKNILPERPSQANFSQKMEHVLASRQNSTVDTKNMCYIPEGVIKLEEVVHSSALHVEAFYMDRTEVSNDAYEKFILATGYPYPSDWKNVFYDGEYREYPVVNVNWYSAKLYAAWQGKRLPTEAEWERAAHGEQYKQWPWGNAFSINLANVEGQTRTPVGKFIDSPSVFGLLDMSGNVWEWTDSWYIEGQEYDKVIRGGSFYSSRWKATTSYREGFFPESSRDDIGFRCVK